MLKKLGIVCLVWMSIGFVVGCTTLQTSSASVCLIPFDYADEGINEQNARALLLYYCLCKNEKACTKKPPAVQTGGNNGSYG